MQSGGKLLLESLESELKTKFGEELIQIRDSVPGEKEIFVKPGRLLELLGFLKDSAGGAFVHLADLSAYDDFPNSPRFYVFYELISMQNRIRLRVVAPVDSHENPTHPSICSLWAGASWLEREVYDMFGIQFLNHPDLRRILLPTSFEGHPLRKDFNVFYRQKFKSESLEEEVFDPFGNTEVLGVE